MQGNKKDYVCPKIRMLTYMSQDVIRTSETAVLSEYGGFNAEWIAGTNTDEG